MRYLAITGCLVTLATCIPVQSNKPTPTVPRCTEDVVLVGKGQFDRGRWSKYVCGPALDDYAGWKAWK